MHNLRSKAKAYASALIREVFKDEPETILALIDGVVNTSGRKQGAEVDVEASLDLLDEG